MGRLKANLAYMAALADRKPDVKVPPHPAYLSAPNLSLSLKLRVPSDAPEISTDPSADREERDSSLKALYSRLQAAFPGVDPKKEPTFRMPAPGQKPGGNAPGAAGAGAQASPTTQQAPQPLVPAMSAPSAG